MKVIRIGEIAGFISGRTLRAQRSWHGLTGESPVGVIARHPVAYPRRRELEPNVDQKNWIHLQLGVAFFYNAQYKEAIAEIQAALRINPKHQGADQR